MPLTTAGTERGAILIFTAVLLLVLIGFAALAVDLGNAWAHDREGQTALDLATLSALQELPHTFHDGTPPVPPAEAAEVEAAAELALLVATNADNATIVSESLDFSAPDEIAYTTSLTVTSNNAFGTVLGVDDIEVASAAVATLIVNEPSVDLLPFGFAGPTSGNPYRCFATSPTLCETDPDRTPPTAPPGTDVSMVALRRQDTPSPCTDAQDTMTADLRDGADHLIDTVDTGIRDEAAACDYGHIVTMPTTTIIVPASRGDMTNILTDGLGSGGGRLAGNSQRIWDFLEPPLSPECQDVGPLPESTPEELEAKAEQMSLCLQSSTVNFSSALNSSDRLVWGIDTGPGGSGVTFEGYVPVWLHHSIDPAGDESIAPPAGDMNGIAIFVLEEGMLDVPLEFDPGGIDNLEFTLES